MAPLTPAARPLSVRTEVWAGVSTFLASLYIVVVNPALLSQAGLPFAGVVTATVLVSAFSSVMMGLYARTPIVVAPGMGLNAFFTFTVVQGGGISPQVALGAVFWSGVVFLLLSLFNVRVQLVRAIPVTLRHATAAGIGLFIAFIGLTNARFVVADPATLVTFRPPDAAGLVFVGGLALTAILLVRRVPGAIVLGMVATTLAALPVGRGWGDATAAFGQPTLVRWQGLWAPPDLSLLLGLDLVGSLRWAMVPVIFAFLFTDLFDSLATLVGVAEAAHLHDERGEPRHLRRALLTDAVATTLAGLVGSSPGTAYVESAVGVAQGGRTGLTAVVAGLLFLPFLFLSPLLSVVPAVATAPALVLVGVFMMRPLRHVDWTALDEAIPAFLTLVLIPLTFSITQGIVWGFLSWTLLQVATGRGRRVPAVLWVVDVLAVVALWLQG